MYKDECEISSIKMSFHSICLNSTKYPVKSTFTI